jgi:hypothetical protein
LKDFRGELARFEAMLERREPFAIARFGDGEIHIARDTPTNYPDFSYDPGAGDQRWHRDRLVDALRHRQHNYFVAISAPCCVGDAEFFVYRSLAAQSEESLTFACLFVNANYQLFRESWLPLFARHENVRLICHRDASVAALPFSVRGVWTVGDNAWIRDYALIDQLRVGIAAEDVSDSLFLIAAGPFGGIVAQQLFAFAPRNTYLDIGSTLDPLLFGRDTRPYHRGQIDHEICTWDPVRLPAATM